MATSRNGKGKGRKKTNQHSSHKGLFAGAAIIMVIAVIVIAFSFAPHFGFLSASQLNSITGQKYTTTGPMTISGPQIGNSTISKNLVQAEVVNFTETGSTITVGILEYVSNTDAASVYSIFSGFAAISNLSFKGTYNGAQYIGLTYGTSSMAAIHVGQFVVMISSQTAPNMTHAKLTSIVHDQVNAMTSFQFLSFFFPGGM